MNRPRAKSCPWPPVSRSEQPRPPRRAYDPAMGRHAVWLHPGDYYATAAEDETLTTVLGTCVAACIRNPHLGYGGMNHFMLPASESGEWGGVPAAPRYGNYAMEILIGAVLKSGCRRNDLEIWLFGGADFGEGPLRVGEQNALFALHYLKHEGLHPLSVDLGGSRPRVIQFTPATGAITCRLLEQPGRRILERERRYEAGLRAGPPGDPEPFR